MNQVPQLGTWSPWLPSTTLPKHCCLPGSQHLLSHSQEGSWDPTSSPSATQRCEGATKCGWCSPSFSPLDEQTASGSPIRQRAPLGLPASCCRFPSVHSQVLSLLPHPPANQSCRLQGQLVIITLHCSLPLPRRAQEMAPAHRVAGWALRPVAQLRSERYRTQCKCPFPQDGLCGGDGCYSLFLGWGSNVSLSEGRRCFSLLIPPGCGFTDVVTVGAIALLNLPPFLKGEKG